MDVENHPDWEIFQHWSIAAFEHASRCGRQIKKVAAGGHGYQVLAGHGSEKMRP